MNNLPELPTPLPEVVVVGDHDSELRHALEDYYDAEQMRAYAIAALTAQQPVGGGGVVAWRIDYRDGTKIALFEQPAPAIFESCGATITPLYTTPPSAQAAGRDDK